MSKLAINGGSKVREALFPAHRTISEEEKEAAIRVIEKGKLSRFLGTWHPDFFGGEEVQALEKEWAEKFGAKHAISVNSATSGLYCALGAAGVGPGDEVIVSPYTMAASATAPIIFNAVPVFADIEPDHYCLDPASVERCITPRTKAIVAVDIFGQPYDADAINAIAKKHNLLVIEDAAQAPGATYKGKYAGTLGDMGVYSMNYHKHIHSGEGGIVVTDNDELADRLRLIRNHAEAVVERKGYTNLINMVGFNFRMTELEAAVCREQLKKLEGLLDKRLENVAYLVDALKEIPCLVPAAVRPDSKNAFYIHTFRFDAAVAGVSRDRFIDAVKAELPCFELRESEGVKLGVGYVKPLYMQPMFQELIAYGDKGCPFKCPHYTGVLNYQPGVCPVCEEAHFTSLVTQEFIVPSMSTHDLDDVAAAFKKVWEHIGELRS